MIKPPGKPGIAIIAICFSAKQPKRTPMTSEPFPNVRVQQKKQRILYFSRPNQAPQMDSFSLGAFGQRRLLALLQVKPRELLARWLAVSRRLAQWPWPSDWLVWRSCRPLIDVSSHQFTCNLTGKKHATFQDAPKKDVSQVLQTFMSLEEVGTPFFPKAWRRVLPLGSLELFS